MSVGERWSNGVLKDSEPQPPSRTCCGRGLLLEHKDDELKAPDEK
jgi:hypothetical protein